MRLIYLAGPYSDTDESVRQQRVDAYAETVAHFLGTTENLFIFSPILYHAPLADKYNLSRDFSFWAQRDFFMIRQSSAMWVLTLPGWEDSFGVSQEMEFAESIGRDILYVIPEIYGYVLMDRRPDPHLPIG